MKKSLFFFSLSFLFFAVLIQAQDISYNTNQVTKPYGQLPLADGSAITITQSTSQTIIAGNSVSCNAGGLHTNNSYFRAFNLTSFGITEDFNISMVEIGIEQATGAGGTQPITVNLWTSSQPFPNGFPGSVTQIGTANINVPDQQLTLFQIPITGTAPAGSELVVEIFTPDGQTTGNSFFIGSNNLGQTGPSYLLAADCGVTVPTTTGGIGFPGMHIVMNVTGEAGGSTARLQVIHNAADVLADPVDIYLNGSLLLNDFAFRAATPFIDAPAGVLLNIGVAPGNSGSVNDTLKNFQVTLAVGETYVAFANGVLNPSLYAANPDGRSTAFTLFVKPQARETGLGSDVDFFVLHGSTDAPTVDIKAGSTTLVNDAAYGDITPYIQVPPANYVLDLYLADGVTLVGSFNAPLSGLGGGAAAVFASGFLDPTQNQNGEGFGIFAALPNGTVIDFPVPVELTSFTGSVNNLGQVILNWETATELNNQGFEIERRTETSEYRTIGFVEGYGTTTEPRSYIYTDRTAENGINYYRLKQVDFSGTYEYSDEVAVDVTGPLTFDLAQNYPNPFNPTTNIKFSVPESGNVRLSVYNLVGEEVAVLVNGFSQAGTFEVTFDASNLSTGVYLYKLQSANSVQTKNMMLLK